MSRINEYDKVITLSDSDVLIVDGTNGTRIIDAETAAEVFANKSGVADGLADLRDEFDRTIAELRELIDSKVDNGYADAQGYLLLTSNGEDVSDPIGPFAGGSGGGGGGGTTTDAVMTARNISGWSTKTTASSDECTAILQWSSIENELPTGNGTLNISVGRVVKAIVEVEQGTVSINLMPYLSSGSNTVSLTLSDVYGQNKRFNMTVVVVDLIISSMFDTTVQYDGAIRFTYIPYGEVQKTVHMIVDGIELNTVVVTASGRQQTYVIPAQQHGAHSIRCYFEATINEQTVRSNELYYEFMSVDPESSTTIITSQFHTSTMTQYSSIPFTFTVYNPSSMTAAVELYVNGTKIAELTVDRTEQYFSYRANDYGNFAFAIVSGGVTKTINVTITQSDIDVEAETQDLVLHLTSQGRSNQEEYPNTWVSDVNGNTISAAMTGFNNVSDGWMLDSDGATVLRVSGSARVSVPYEVFANDFRGTGKTIEIEFATRNVLDYDASIMSCMNGGRGFSLTAQEAILVSEQSEISTQYKEDEHVRIAFVAEKRSENRLLSIYINGINSGTVQYPTDDDFSQVSPVGISIGSSYCTIDIYNIRIYDNNLTRFQIVDNWIADTQDASLMFDRYERNNIFDAYGNIVISKLPSDLCYMVISCDELPQSKGDKKICSGYFVNPLNPGKSFTFENCQIDVQGTSSQYYARKNYKMKFNGGFVLSSTGATISKYSMNDDAIPVKTFCMKADYASSEGANNVELVRLYNDACPYKTPAQVENSKVRQGIDGFPIVIFWNDTVNNTTSFIGKYNFNNDKSTEEVFGFASPDESWEVLNNASDRVLFKSGDFSGDGWKADFEARYPDTDPAYEDVAQLSEFAAWAASTDTTAATNEALASSVTYDGVTYTTDTAAYRLAKFKAEAGDYMEMQSALFYYLFTELFLMVDSRAKNAFPSFIGSEVTAS